MSIYYSDDGFTITNGKGYMGIHSACEILNDEIAKNLKLQAQNEKLKKFIEKRVLVDNIAFVLAHSSVFDLKTFVSVNDRGGRELLKELTKE